MTITERRHVVAVPYPAQGHITPLLQLCRQLLPLGFTFTFVNTHHIHHRLQAASHGVQVDAVKPDLRPHEDRHQHIDLLKQENVGVAQAYRHDRPDSLHSSATHPKPETRQKHRKGCGNFIDMAFVEGGSPPEEHAHIATIKQVFNAAQDMKESVEQLISKVMETRRVAFLLTDILLGWSCETASKFGLPWVTFWAASAASFAGLALFADLAEQGKRVDLPDDKEADLPVLEDIPGLPPTYLGDLPTAWESEGDLPYHWLKFYHTGRQARFLLFNTFEELEAGVLQALSRREYPTLAVRPLLPAPFHSMGADGLAANEEACFSRASLFREDSTCLDWLDEQASESVLFISFGSISLRSEDQLEELAQGLEASGCAYLWVRHRPGPAGEAAGLPAVKPERHGRGLTVAWVPQLEVLSHFAVGGFLTHCGWNSVMEGVAMGVPMLCWADFGERMCNQRFVVQIWRCGLDMVPDGRRYKQHIDDEAVVVKRDEIENSVRCLMVEQAGASVRARAARLRDAAAVAVRDSRSKLLNFAEVMQEHTLSDPTTYQ